MWSAGRRLPARVAQQPQLLTGRMLGQQTLALQRHVAPLASRHQQLQVRAFFGLKDWLIGDKKKDATATTDEAATQAATADASATTAVAGEAPPAVEQPEASAEPLVGSLDPIQYSVGKYARLADGAIMSTQGKTMVLSTTVSPASTSGAKKKDFLPLMVDYRIKFHAVGLIPDTQRRSEMTNTDEEILESRIIDRVIRPLFPRDYVDETQVIATVHSLDPANDPLVLAVNSTSAALAVSDIPWNGPVGCVRVVEINGQLVANPTKAQRDAATLDIVYAANATRVLMIEADGHEIPEERMAEALRFAHEKVQPLLAEQKKLVEQHGKPKREYVRTVVPEDVAAKAREIGVGQLFSGPRAAKMDRRQAEHETYEALLAGLREAFAGREDVNDDLFQIAAHDVVQTALRERILAGDRNSRLDGRSHSMIRPLQIETDVLPMAHGSSVFGRGDTQALCSVTLGPLDRGLRLRTAHQNPKNEAEFKHAILHYEFPPYCVNETGRMGGVNRRMVGHGALAEKAIVPVLPSTETFPFTVRMTSETMGSDGSSSMATVCGVCMALMDAGVPIKTPVAGISIGLVTEGDPFDGTKPIGSYRLLTDILGTEDHYGDMDFKIAGTDTGITAIQLDVKLPGVPLRILCQGLQHAKKARSFVLKRMAAELAAPREQLKSTTSAVTGTTEGTSGVHGVIKFSVPANSIGSLIGTGGSTIREIENATGCSISIVDRNKGEIRVTGPAEALESAQAIVQEQTGSAAHSFYKVGGKYEMRVVEVMDFGAILEATAPTKNRGFVHITELADTRVTNIHDVIKVGQVLEFACLQEGVSGKMSIKALRAGEGAAADGPEGTTTPKRPVSGVPKRRAKSIHTTARPHRTTKATVDNKSQE